MWTCNDTVSAAMHERNIVIECTLYSEPWATDLTAGKGQIEQGLWSHYRLSSTTVSLEKGLHIVLLVEKPMIRMMRKSCISFNAEYRVWEKSI